MNDLELIKRVARTKKKLSSQQGWHSLQEIKTAYDVAKRNGAKRITLLYCVSKYLQIIKILI